MADQRDITPTITVLGDSHLRRLDDGTWLHTVSRPDETGRLAVVKKARYLLRRDGGFEVMP